MSDLTTILKARARTGKFHGNTAADEQAYYELFGQDTNLVSAFALLPHLVKFASAQVTVFGRKPFSRARLT